MPHANGWEHPTAPFLKTLCNPNVLVGPQAPYAKRCSMTPGSPFHLGLKIRNLYPAGKHSMKNISTGLRMKDLNLMLFLRPTGTPLKF